MARLIGIDYGRKRTGLAVTDPEKRIAGVLGTVESYEIYNYLEKYLQKETVEGFVIGFPRQMNFQPSESAPLVQAFAKGLMKKFPAIPVFWVDERFTSKMALQSMIDGGSSKADRRDKGNIDAVSAAIILESWLQQKINERERKL
ncbi:MAG: Holliday junction resolvase RuvX [Bacteroidales bacterium]|jgi:putative Holliday junction resolvase